MTSDKRIKVDNSSQKKRENNGEEEGYGEETDTDMRRTVHLGSEKGGAGD